MLDDVAFQGGVFSDELPDGRAGAEIELQRDRIVARVPTGETYSLTYSECQLEIGGSSGRMIFCRNQDRSVTIFCEDSNFPVAMERQAAGLLGDQLDRLIAGRKSAWYSSMFGWSVGLTIFAGVLALLYFGIMWAALAAVESLPMSVDKQIGEAAMKTMDLPGERVTDPEIVKPIQEMVERLAPHSTMPDLDYTVIVVRAPIFNAFAVPGGKIVVYTGLIEKTKTPEQLAGVLAHEMAHVTGRHGLKQISRSLSLTAAIGVLLGDVGGLAGLGATLFEQSALSSHSRAHETEADLEGARMMHESGLDPAAMSQFMHIAAQEGPQNRIVELSWFASHPDESERIEKIDQFTGELDQKKYEKLQVDWDQYQRHLHGEDVPQ